MPDVTIQGCFKISSRLVLELTFNTYVFEMTREETRP